MVAVDESEDWSGTYYEQEQTEGQSDDGLVYLGQGKFSRKNPKGSDGRILTCSMCGSEDHFVKNCPQNTQNLSQAQVKAGGKGQSGKKNFVSWPGSSTSGSGSISSSSDWGSMIYVGGAQEIEHNSTSFIELADGTFMQLDALDSVPEEVDNLSLIHI